MRNHHLTLVPKRKAIDRHRWCRDAENKVARTRRTGMSVKPKDVDLPKIWTPIFVLIQPIYTASADIGYVKPPSNIGGTKDLGTAPGKETWSHYNPSACDIYQGHITHSRQLSRTMNIR